MVVAARVDFVSAVMVLYWDGFAFLIRDKSHMDSVAVEIALGRLLFCA